MRSVHLRVLGSAVAIVAAVALAFAIAGSVARPSAAAIAAIGASPLPAAVSAIAEAPPIVPTASASAGAAPPKPARCPPEPAIEVHAAELPSSAEELLRLALEQPEALGSASIGAPTRGALFGGVELGESEGITHAGGYAWGTASVVRSIERAVREVRRCFPGTQRLHVGDISRERGGWLRPHRSHQSGLDADIGYYYLGGSTWYQRATAKNLDVPRTWALVRAFIEGGNVEMIFMDVSVQRLVETHIASLPEEERPPEDLFASPTKKDTIIRHAWGHATHFHVRFTDPAASALGARLSGILPRLRRARPASKKRR